MASKRILITAGGTGGHVYPAQALAQQCLKRSNQNSVIFVAGGLQKNRYFDRQVFSFREISCSPLLSYHPMKFVKGFYHLTKGFFQSIATIKEYRPDVVVGFGSYYTVPVLLAAKWLRVPIVLHEANSIPGRTNQWLSSLATKIGLHFPSSSRFFKGNAVEVGLPLREGFSLNAVEKEKALEYFGLSINRQTLLICGGSQGARQINHVIQDCIPTIRELSLQVIHCTGDAAMAESLSAIYRSHDVLACVKPFEAFMQMAWRAADIFIGRAGASTIAEAMEFEVPGILIPYPHATDDHQNKNADFFVDTVGGGLKRIEDGISHQTLSEAIHSLIRSERYLNYKRALQAYKHRPHQMSLCDLIFNLNS